jgi:hypothetical protein
MAQRPPRFYLMEVMVALVDAGIDADGQMRVFAELKRRIPKRGRTPESDDELVLRALAVSRQDEISINAAAAQIAQEFPDSQREAVRKRIARKAKQYRKRERMIQSLRDAAETGSYLEHLRGIFSPKKR